MPYQGKNLERIFSLQFERTVNGQHGEISGPDSGDRTGALAGNAGQCTVTLHQHLDQTLSLSYGPHSLGRYDERGGRCSTQETGGRKNIGKDAGWKSQKADFAPAWHPQSARDSAPPPRRLREN